MKTKFNTTKNTSLQTQPTVDLSSSSSTPATRSTLIRKKYDIINIDNNADTTSTSSQSATDLKSIVLIAKSSETSNESIKTINTAITKIAKKSQFKQFSSIDTVIKNNSSKVLLSENKGSLKSPKRNIILDAIQSLNKYTAYKVEQGIDTLEPEILFVLNMLPLYEFEDVMTQAGQYFTAQTYIRNLKSKVVMSVMNDYSFTQSLLHSKAQSEFSKSIDTLWSHIEFLYTMIDNFDSIKIALDVGRRSNDIDIDNVISFMRNNIINNPNLKTDLESSKLEKNTSNTSILKTKITKNSNVFDSSNIFDGDKSGTSTPGIPKMSNEIGDTFLAPSYKLLPSKRNFVDLLTLYGYSQDRLSTFHSTKVWLQTLLMIRNILVAGTSHMKNNQKMFPYITDKSRTVIVGNYEYDPMILTVKNLSINENSINDIVENGKNQSISNTIIDIFSNSFKELSDKTKEDTTANLISNYILFLSRELRYGELKSDALLSTFNYTQDQDTNGIGNQRIFDSIFNVKLGDAYITMASNPKSNLEGSLSGLSYSTPIPNVLVSTFDNSYTKTSQNGTFTPGFEYYVESVLDTVSNGEFRIDRLNLLKSAIENENSKFATILNSGNLMAQFDTNRDQTKYYVSDPETFIQSVMNDIINPSTGRLRSTFIDDEWIPLFSFSTKYPKIQTYLFLIVLLEMNISNSSDKTTKSSIKMLCQKMSNYIFNSNGDINLQTYDPNTLGKSEKSSDPNTPHTEGLTKFYPSINFQAAMYKNGKASHSPFLEMIKSLISSYISSSTYNAKSKVQISKPDTIFVTKEVIFPKTKYSDFSDTAIAMVIFKLMCHIADQFCENKIKGFTTFVQIPYLFASYTDKTYKTAQTNVVDQVKNELSLTRECILTLLGSMNLMKVSLNKSLNHFTNKISKANAKSLYNIVNDKNLFNFLLDEAQLRLLSIDAYELKRKSFSTINEESTNKLFDLNPCTPTLLRCISSVFKNDQFMSEKGFNKKIMTIGIPNGMSSILDSTKRVELNGDDVNLENDIVKIKVYKQDLEYPDVIFEPIEYLFELSRFTIEDESLIKTITNESQFNDVMKSIPTRDITSLKEIYNLVPEYGQDLDNSMLMFKGSQKQSKKLTSRIPLSDKKYSFLTSSQKNEIIRNHVLSWILTLYTTILTGIDTDERRFIYSSDDIQNIGSGMLDMKIKDEMINSGLQMAQMVSKMSSNQNVKKSGPGSIFTTVSELDISDTLGINNSQPNLNFTSSKLSDGTFKSSLASFSSINPVASLTSTEMKNVENDSNAIDYVTEFIEVVQDIDSLVSIYTSDLSLLQRYLYPRKFERIFNIVVDPDDFNINIEETIKTSSGKKSLENMTSLGLISDESSLKSNYSVAYSSKSTTAGSQKVNTKEKKEGDFSFEKYFIVIETMRS